MILRSLYLHHFRNYEDALFHFSPGINVIYGNNAQGKTTILEAIYFLMTAQSFRTSQVKELIKHDTECFFLEAHFIKYGINQKLRIAYDGKERKIVYNNTIYQSSGLVGLLQGVIMTPDDLDLIKGSPQERRRFLDLHIAQHTPLYIHHLTRYHRAMKQRNHLLRTHNLASIESWEHEMSNAAAYLTTHRMNAIKELQVKCQPIHNILSDENENVTLNYKTHSIETDAEYQIRDYYLAQFSRQRRREMELGSTLSGPHKDDLSIELNQNDIRSFASEGQQRSFIGALRLAEWHRLRELTEEKPIMMIDDLGMSFDGKRKENFFNQLTDLGQVFVTSTDPLPMNASTSEHKHFKVKKGQIESG